MATAGSVLSIRDSVLARYASAWPAALAGGLSFGVTLTLAAESGGYFSRTWGFVALALLWIGALGLALRERIRLGRLEQATLAALVGLLLWTALSALWSESAAPPLREANRTVIYVAGLLAVLLVVRSTSYKALLTGAWAAIALACSYALATRLFPERLADAADLVANRLDEPIGYWNALGIFAVLGFLLALGIAARGRGVLLRAAAASSTVILAPTVYFTFGRGPWLALAVGLGAMLALDSRRLQLIATLLVVAPWPSLAVWSSSRFDALTERNPNLAAAADDGRQLAAVVVALAVAAGLAASVLALLEPRVRLSPRTRLVIACALGAAVLAGLGGVFATQGSPVTIAERAYDQLDRPVAPNPDLQGRLFGLSSPGRIANWRVAWDQYRDSSVIGGAGAGTFERYWLQDQRATGPVRDAHNLYLEMVAELGLVGLALLFVALGVPLLAAVKARRRALVPAAFGAYVAYLVHAGIDWDWEMPAVTVPALLCAGGVLLAARDSETGPISTPVRAGLVAVVVAMMAFAFVGTMGYQALEASEDAEDARRLEKAESEARKAARWLPWSAEPWRALAEVHFDRNDRPQARVALLEALERDSGDWALWYNLGAATDGPARLVAYRKAARLNPLSRNVAVLRRLGLLPPLPSTTESGSSPR